MTSGAEAVGRRVVVRYRVGGTGPSGGPALTDVVGRLLAADRDALVVQARDGRVQRIDRADVVASRIVPDRPVRTRRPLDVAAEDLERITSRGWPAMVSEPLGEWELRASRGFTGRANSVLAAGDPGVPVDEALRRVQDFHAAHGVPPAAQVVTGSAEEADLVERGWVPSTGERPGAVVQVATVDRSHRPDPEARVAPRADDAWLARYGRAEDPVAARAVMEAAPVVGFVSLGPAIGRVVVTGEWAGLSCVEVDPEHRRRGWARRVVETSLAWAAHRGADKAYLQTMRGNEPALALYEPFGFVDHHEYRYLVPGRPA